MKRNIIVTSLSLGMLAPMAAYAIDALTVATNGHVGIGTDTPAAALHVRKLDASVRVEDINNATTSGVLVELQKQGVPAFRLTNTGNGSSWDFTQRTNQNFTLSKSGSGGFEMEITPTGDVHARGDVFARGVMLTSSRAAKTDFTEIKTSDVMKKLTQVNVEEWRYKEADKNDRHISPMAEDFYALFKLGPDNKHINPNDLASVALIAAKELQKKSDALNVETNALKADNTLLKEQTLALKATNDSLQVRLASLEKLVTNLAAANGALAGKAKKVALNMK